VHPFTMLVRDTQSTFWCTEEYLYNPGLIDEVHTENSLFKYTPQQSLV